MKPQCDLGEPRFFIGLIAFDLAVEVLKATSGREPLAQRMGNAVRDAFNVAGTIEPGLHEGIEIIRYELSVFFVHEQGDKLTIKLAGPPRELPARLAIRFVSILFDMPGLERVDTEIVR